MTLKRRSPGILTSWLVLILLYSAIFSISCKLAVTSEPSSVPYDTSVASAILGDSRTAIGAHFYETADLYFHRGVAHKHAEAFEHSFFQRLHEDVSPSKHVHASGQSVKEIMPWLWMSIQMDPGNVETYLVAAFWLAGEGARPDLALEVLRTGQCNMAFNYEIQLAKGRIYLRNGDVSNAQDAFDAALAFWPGDSDPSTRTALLDKAEALLCRALIHEADGERMEASTLLREVVSIFPDRTELLPRIKALEQGRQPEHLAKTVWNDMLEQYSQKRTVCHRDEHEHEHDHEHDHEHNDGEQAENHVH